MKAAEEDRGEGGGRQRGKGRGDKREAVEEVSQNPLHHRAGGTPGNSLWVTMRLWEGQMGPPGQRGCPCTQEAL